ncbi:CoA-binding protein [Afifella sp. IM 167]|uniref:succinate--CoA ligase subunit alpha n=1 Tax=Afifella sp. IM 167 TaxID=2033586 RepID=UPI001CCBEAE6|nr:CoA-binding protein [Afifella sp. IM 167]MBZ8133329.1 succinate--CoA ligase subunit alpha [Afifella sp. IM 167]
MAALAERNTHAEPAIFGIPASAGVLVQGATGRIGARHMGLMRAAGSNVVGGVSPSGRTSEVDGVPVFTSCAEAVGATGARMSVVMVPPLQVLPAIEDAVAAGIDLVVSITEGVPVADAMRALALTKEAGVRWVGSSTPGIAIPGVLKLGFLPDATLSPGPLGVMSKSGTLSYEVSWRLVAAGLGQSSWIGVGGDPVKGTRFADLLPYFAEDPATRAVIAVGEIGGSEEEELAAAIRDTGFAKPLYAIIAGQGAREGISMGHAGALIAGGAGTLASKAEALQAAGAHVFFTIRELAEAVAGSPDLRAEAQG